MTRKQKRMAVIGGLGVVMALATGLILIALRDQIVFFYSPSEVLARELDPGAPFRIGGLVKEGSLVQRGEIVDFVVTDGEGEMAVHFVGILPDLFKEGQGVVAEGSLGADGRFAATNVLARHDENYMPREVVEALKQRGEWQREGAPL